MRTLLATALCATLFCVAARGADERPRLGDKAALQLYSLRNEFPKRGVGPTLDLVKSWGIKYVEVAGTYGMEPAQFRAELDKRGLVPIGAHFPYDKLQKDIPGIIKEAKALGIPYVGCAYIGHKKPFNEAQCLKAAEVFNKAGAELAKHGLKFYYHNHGYEFYKHGDGTLFDLLAAKTDPKLVSFEIDVLWAVLPGQDPAALVTKYADRFKLVHLKDLKKGVPTGDMSAHTDLTNDVALGTGQVNWTPFLKATEKAGIKYYFIEDESPSAVEQIPQSLKFIR